ncbi:MAG: saccharopine dehydrogenase NADP-binding domain-containing protein [Candidatus Eremiobacteraeota bacterium]|nr:saccharopine dehydrogenase NADP-binding domain-containing protein [Candidatus Eremiobacteraeota bacterium]
MKSILVLGGCGAMGNGATRDLAAYSDFDTITVADLDLDKAGALAQELEIEAQSVDVTDKNALIKVFGDHDIVLNCTSYAFGLGITEAAIEARKPMLDLGGLYNTPKQLAMTDKAKEAGVTIVLGMGATPGVSNLMARAGASRMDSVDSIHIHFATYRSIAPSPGLLQTVLDEFSPSTKRFYHQDGELIEVDPFEGEKMVTFDAPIGRIPTWFVPHSETHTLPRFIPGVKRVDVRGTWRPEIMHALKHYNEVGLLDAEPLNGVVPKDLLRDLFLQCGDWPGPGEWCFYVNVEVKGRRNEAEVTATYNISHPGREQWGEEATGRVTGIPASIGAQMIAQGRALSPGVLGPEAAFEPWEFFTELAKRDIKVREEVLEVRSA